MLKERYILMKTTQEKYKLFYKKKLLDNKKHSSIEKKVINHIYNILFTKQPSFRMFYLEYMLTTYYKDLTFNNLDKLPLFIELEVQSMYYYNEIYDQKNGVVNIDAIISNSTNSNIFYSVLDELYYLFFYNTSLFPHIFKMKNKVRKIFYIGEQCDRLYLNMNNFNSINEVFEKVFSFDEKYRILNEIIDNIVKEMSELVSNTPESLIYAYVRRSWMINGYLYYGFIDLLNIIGEKNKYVEEIEKFTILFGIMAQISNDIIDYCPEKEFFKTKHKDKFDNLSDLRNGIYTFPFLIIDKKERKFIKKMMLKKNNKKDVENYIENKGFYKIFISKYEQLYYKIMKKYIEGSQLIKKDLILKDTWDFLIKNKYFVVMK